MSKGRGRFALHEYGAPSDLLGQISSNAAISKEMARRMIELSADRIARTLRLSYRPIIIDSSGVRAVDVAGMIRLAPKLELEIVPKFLNEAERDGCWREDFYFLANLSKHGRLLSSERIRASGAQNQDLTALVARSLSDMYWDNRRKPLRSYRRVQETGFFIDGDIDPVDLKYPSQDGFSQELIHYDRINSFNAMIYTAASELLPEVSEPEAVAGLVKLLEDMPKQSQVKSVRRKPIPSRYRQWQPVVELASDVIKGFGISLQQGYAAAPGYIINTWKIWEDLLVLSSRIAFGRSAVASQRKHILGQRMKPNQGTTGLNVYPDILVTTGETPFIIDAKYKVNAEKGRYRILEADIYEALAFAKASKCKFVVLAYPTLLAEAGELGASKLFETVSLEGVMVLGISVEVRGISKRNGLYNFSQKMKIDIEEILKNHV